MVFLSIKSLPNLLFGVLCLPGDQSHPFAQPTINPLARCICWAGLLGRAVFPPWNEGPNFGSYKRKNLFFFFLLFVTQKLLISTLAVNTVDWLGLDHFSIRSPSISYGQGGVVTRYQHGCWESTLWTVEFSEKEK